MLLNNLHRDTFKQFVLIEVCSVDLLVTCLRICTGFVRGSIDFFREKFGRTDKIDLITTSCFKKLNVPDAFLIRPFQ